MSDPNHERRRQQAVAATSSILSLLDAEIRTNEVLLWRNRFAEIADLLSNREINTPEALHASAERMRALHQGGRAITDFYLTRSDFEDQRHLNAVFEAERARLWNALADPDP
ncbi:hypothetical protein, partial [Nocardia sp. NPDC004722]